MCSHPTSGSSLCSSSIHPTLFILSYLSGKSSNPPTASRPASKNRRQTSSPSPSRASPQQSISPRSPAASPSLISAQKSLRLLTLVQPLIASSSSNGRNRIPHFQHFAQDVCCWARTASYARLRSRGRWSCWAWTYWAVRGERDVRTDTAVPVMLAKACCRSLEAEFGRRIRQERRRGHRKLWVGG
jgi:hypothetical protein